MIYYNIFFILSFILSIVYVFRYQKHYDVNITAIFLLIPIANLGNVFLAMSRNLDQALVANRVVYLGGCFLTYFITFAIFNLCEFRVHPVIRTLLLIVNSTVFGFILTTGSNQLFYKKATFERAGKISYLVKEYGPIHTVFYLLILFYLVAGLITIIYTYFQKKQVSRVMLYLLFLPEFFSFLGYIGGRIYGLKYELTPIAYVFAQIVFLLIAQRISFYKTSDMAIETMLENGENGFISINLSHKYLGSNQTAKNIFPELLQIPVDGSIAKNEALAKTLLIWVKNFEREQESVETMYIKKHPVDESMNRIYTATVNYLFSGRRKIGYQIFLIDETENFKYIRLLNGYNSELEAEVEKKTEHIIRMHNKLILSMASMVESRDNSTGGHIKRTSDDVRILIDEIKKDNKLGLSDEFCKNLIKAAPMHDLGKIAVPDNILKLERRFTPEEFDQMKKHAAEGAKIVHEILKDTDDEAFHILAENVAHYHHERYNGSGYPDGLKDEEIPIEARIMAIADVYDALVSKRCYKESMSFEEADRIIMEGMGTHFDPQLEEYYVKARPRLEEYYRNVAE